MSALQAAPVLVGLLLGATTTPPESPPDPPPAILKLQQACPSIEAKLALSHSAREDASRPWWNGIEARLTADGVELRSKDEPDSFVSRRNTGEYAERVLLPSCASLGYKWGFEYSGGIVFSAIVRPSFYRNGLGARWNSLARSDQTTLLAMMSAREGSGDEQTLAGLLYRPASPDPAPTSGDSPPRGPRYSLVHWPGRPRDEGRVFFPCSAGAKDLDCSTCECAGHLFLGARLGKLQELDGFEIYGVEVSPGFRPQSIGRIWGIGKPFAIYERASNRHIYVTTGNDAGWGLSSTRRIGAAAFVVTRARSFSVFSSTWQDYLFDFASGNLYELPGAEGGEDYWPVAMREEDATRRIIWYKEGHGVVVDYAKLLASRGERGIERIPADKTLAFGKAQKSASVILTAFLLTEDKAVARAALAALSKLPGWKMPASAVVSLRDKCKGERAVVRKNPETPPKANLPPEDPGWSLYLALGSSGPESFLIPWSGENRSELSAHELAAKASATEVFAVPRQCVVAWKGATRK